MVKIDIKDRKILYQLDLDSRQTVTQIGKKVHLENAFIGPYTSIGDNVQIINSEIEDSVIMNDSEINEAGRITESLIGRGVKISKGIGLPKGQKFVLGDNSEVIV